VPDGPPQKSSPPLLWSARPLKYTGNSRCPAVFGLSPRVQEDGRVGEPTRAMSQFKRFGSSSKHAEICQESFGIVVWRSVGTVPGILGPNPIRNRGSPAVSLKVFGALLAQPSHCQDLGFSDFPRGSRRTGVWASLPENNRRKQNLQRAAIKPTHSAQTRKIP
jgi:hypothetical protein